VLETSLNWLRKTLKELGITEKFWSVTLPSLLWVRRNIVQRSFLSGFSLSKFACRLHRAAVWGKNKSPSGCLPQASGAASRQCAN